MKSQSYVSILVPTRRAGRALAFVVALGSAVYASHSAAQRPAAPATAGTFEVHLFRRSRVGTRARMTIEGEKHQVLRVTTNGAVQREQNENVTVHFRAVETVVSVDPHGKALQSNYLIERFESEDSGHTTVVVPPGQTISVTRAAHSAQSQVTVGGHPIEAPVRDALDLVISLTIGETTDDDVFGTTQRQAVGATWPMHADLAQRDMANTTGIQATLSGHTTLANHSAVNGVDALEFVGEMTGTLSTLPNLPPGSVVRTGTLTATNHSVVPTAPNAPGISSSTLMNMQVVVDLPPDPHGARSEINLTLREQKTETAAPL